jgi:hypothetical protein
MDHKYTQFGMVAQELEKGADNRYNGDIMGRVLEKTDT